MMKLKPLPRPFPERIANVVRLTFATPVNLFSAGELAAGKWLINTLKLFSGAHSRCSRGVGYYE